VVLPGGGTVYLRSLRLVENWDPAAWSEAGTWWSDRTGGLIGGVSGSALGVLGGLIGVLASVGKARKLVLGTGKVVAAAGAVLLALGLIALVGSQPYGVWYPLVLTGVIGMAVFGGLLPVMRKRFEQIELRKMAAMDVS
jgi:hypothetical protein